MMAKKRTPSSPLLTPPPQLYSPPYPPFSRGTPYFYTVFSWKPCVCTGAPFPLLFSLLFCAPPDAYHRTSGRRVKYIASLVELLAGRLCSTVVFLPSRQASRKTCRLPSFESPCGTVARVSYLIFRSPGMLTSPGTIDVDQTCLI